MNKNSTGFLMALFYTISTTLAFITIAVPAIASIFPLRFKDTGSIRAKKNVMRGFDDLVIR